MKLYEIAWKNVVIPLNIKPLMQNLFSKYGIHSIDDFHKIITNIEQRIELAEKRERYLSNRREDLQTEIEGEGTVGVNFVHSHPLRGEYLKVREEHGKMVDEVWHLEQDLEQAKNVQHWINKMKDKWPTPGYTGKEEWFYG